MLCKIVSHICNNASTFNPTKILTTNPISVPADNAIAAPTYTPTNRLSYLHHQSVTKYQRKLQHLLSMTITYDNRLRPIRIYEDIKLLKYNTEMSTVHTRYNIFGHIKVIINQVIYFKV